MICETKRCFWRILNQPFRVVPVLSSRESPVSDPVWVSPLPASSLCFILCQSVFRGGHLWAFMEHSFMHVINIYWTPSLPQACVGHSGKHRWTRQTCSQEASSHDAETDVEQGFRNVGIRLGGSAGLWKGENWSLSPRDSDVPEG